MLIGLEKGCTHYPRIARGSSLSFHPGGAQKYGVTNRMARLGKSFRRLFPLGLQCLTLAISLLRMPQLLIATKNSHKTAEIRAVLAGRFDVTDLCAHPEVPAPEETGKTFSENAAIKALAASAIFEGWVLADDSGLCVDALEGAPGVFSARYAGPAATDADNRACLLSAMSTFPEWTQRRARFQCVLVLAKAGQIRGLFQGAVEGVILPQEEGGGGFGYDPLFVPDGYEQSFGLLSAEIKNAISHRARALNAFQQWLSVTPELA